LSKATDPNQTVACTFKNAATDVDNIASTMVAKKRTAQKIAEIVSHGEGSCFEY